MADQVNLTLAKETFNTLCQAFDNNKLHYEKDEEKMIIECRAQGDDLPIELTVSVDAERMLVLLISRLPFVIQEDKRLDVAIAVSAINNLLADGCFDYNVATGNMFFRMTNSFLESKMGEAVFSYLLFGSFKIIDAYNDKLLMLAKGVVSVEQFLASLEN